MEGEVAVLVCIVLGTRPMNVTWSKIGGPSYLQGHTHTFTSIRRHDEGTYQCTASNGDECPIAAAQSSITVICKNYSRSTGFHFMKLIYHVCCCAHAQSHKHKHNHSHMPYVCGITLKLPLILQLPILRPKFIPKRIIMLHLILIRYLTSSKAIGIPI